MLSMNYDSSISYTHIKTLDLIARYSQSGHCVSGSMLESGSGYISEFKQNYYKTMRIFLLVQINTVQAQ